MAANILPGLLNLPAINQLVEQVSRLISQDLWKLLKRTDMVGSCGLRPLAGNSCFTPKSSSFSSKFTRFWTHGKLMSYPRLLTQISRQDGLWVLADRHRGAAGDGGTCGGSDAAGRRVPWPSLGTGTWGARLPKTHVVCTSSPGVSPRLRHLSRRDSLDQLCEYITGGWGSGQPASERNLEGCRINGASWC